MRKHLNIKYLPYNKNLVIKARVLRKKQTAAEKKLWNYSLRDHKYKFTRQKPIDNFIVDFYCSYLDLVIEIDGDSHIDEKDILYNKRRTEKLEKYGLKVLRFWNYDVLSGVYIVSEIINKEIKKLSKRINPPYPPLSGRVLKLKKI